MSDRQWEQSTYVPQLPTEGARRAAAFRLAAQRARGRGNFSRAEKLELSAQKSDPSTQVLPAPLSDREIYAQWACVGGSAENRGTPSPAGQNKGFWCPKCKVHSVYIDVHHLAARGPADEILPEFAKCVKCGITVRPGDTSEAVSFGSFNGQEFDQKDKAQ